MEPVCLIRLPRNIQHNSKSQLVDDEQWRMRYTAILWLIKPFSNMSSIIPKHLDGSCRTPLYYTVMQAISYMIREVSSVVKHSELVSFACFSLLVCFIRVFSAFKHFDLIFRRQKFWISRVTNCNLDTLHRSWHRGYHMYSPLPSMKS